MCRPGKIASFPLNQTISSKGLVVAMDYYAYPTSLDTQTIFSIRDVTTNSVILRFDHRLVSSTLNIWINPIPATPATAAYYVFDSTVEDLLSISTGNYRLKCDSKC